MHEEEPNWKKIYTSSELRKAYKIYGDKYLVDKLSIKNERIGRIKQICDSEISDSTNINACLNCKDDNFQSVFERHLPNYKEDDYNDRN